MATMARSAVWQEDCPKCESANYYDEGDVTDITGNDIDALECWKCGHVWLTEGVDWILDIEEAFTEKGRKNP